MQDKLGRDSLEFSMSPRPKSHEINKRYEILKKNLTVNKGDDDIVNVGTVDEPNVKNNKNGNIKPKNLLNNLKSRSRDHFNNDNNSLSPVNKSMNTMAFSKTITNKTIVNNLRNKFQRSLGKLNDNDTKEVGFSELKNYITLNNSSEALRVYISLLSIFYNNCTIAAKEVQVLLLGFLATVYKENLMDPLDKPSNIIKTIVRITEIIQVYLKESSIVIHKACSHSLQELYDNCMPKDDLSAIVLIFFDPLITMITSGTNKLAQTGAAVCLSDLISHLGRNTNFGGTGNDEEPTNSLKILMTLDTKIINMLTKIKTDNQYIFQAFYNLLQVIPFENLINSLKEIYDRLILCINSPKAHYLSKITALKIFTLIAKKLKTMADVVIGYYQNEIMLTLQNVTKDRIHKVQLAAHEALKEWSELEELYKEIENKKTLINPQIEDLTKQTKNYNGQEFNKKMDRLTMLRNLSKMNKNEERKIDNDPYNYLKENLKDEIYKKGIGNVLKLSNFLKNKNDQNHIHEMKNSGGMKNYNKSRKNLSPSNLVKEEIKDYLRRSQQVKKYNSIDANLVGVDEEEPKNQLNEKNYDKINNQGEVDNLDELDEGMVEEKQENNLNVNLYTNNTVKSKNRGIDLNLQILKNNLESLITNNLSQLYYEFENKANKLLDKLDIKIKNSNKKINELKNKLEKKHISNNKNDNTSKKLKAQEESYDKDRVEENYNKVTMTNLKNEIGKYLNKESEPPIIKIWKQTLKEVENTNYANAYANILNSKDDLYLLRLLCLTGPILNKLPFEIAEKILLRVNLISRSQQIQSLLLALIENIYKNNLFYKINKHDQNELLETLYEYSGFNSVVGSKSASLYAQITSYY